MNDTGYYLTLTEVCQCVRLSEDTLITIVELGIVEPRGRQPRDWRFEADTLATLRRACRLREDLELEDWAAIALALNLIEEVEALRDDNRRLRQQLACLLEANNG